MKTLRGSISNEGIIYRGGNSLKML